MTTLLVFIGFILLLVGVHEGGHFLMAKLTGVAVEEFALGFGPAIWSRKRGETRYSIRALPLGGFVRLAGEGGAASDVALERTYHGRPAWARFALAAAGPTANVVLALAILLAAVWSIGVPRVQVAGLIEGAPAQEVLQVGDEVLQIGQRRIWMPEDVGPAIQAAAPDAVTITLRREGEPMTVHVTPTYDAQDDVYRVGGYFVPQVLLTEISELEPDAPLAQAGLKPGDRIVSACESTTNSLYELYPKWQDGCREITVQRNEEQLVLTLPDITAERMLEGVAFTELPASHVRPGGDGVALSFRLLGQALTGFVASIRALVAGLVPAGEAVAGPVGIAGILSQGLQAGAWPTLMLVALLSLNLAIINLLPFPALDGARMVFALWEMGTRRRVSPAVENAVHTLGFLILLAGLLLITFWDVVRLIG